MLEQFRILRAALRLSQFTTAQLAEASGVSEGTVQKMLKRRADLFAPTGARAPGRRRRQAVVFTVRVEAVGPALQAAADEAPLLTPLTSGEGPALATADGAPIALELAQELLVRTFPFATDDERPRLLAAAADDLATVSTRWFTERAALAALHGHLVVLLQHRDWLRSLDTWVLVAASGEPPFVIVRNLVRVIDELISGEARAGRDADPARAAMAAANLLELPRRAASLRAHLAADASAPSASWGSELMAAAWGLVAHPLWRDVAGDLSAAETPAPAAAPAAAVAAATPSEAEPAVVFRELEGPDLIVGGSGPLDFDKLRDDGATWFSPFNADKFKGLTLSGKWSEPLSQFDARVELIKRVRSGLAAAEPSDITLHVALTSPREPVHDGFDHLTGYLAAIDFDMVRQRVVGVGVARDKDAVGGVGWVLYRELRVRGRRIRHLSLDAREGNRGIPPRPTHRDARREGACMWEDDATLQVRLLSPIALLGLSTEPEAASHLLVGRRHQRRIADIHAFDIEARSGLVTMAHTTQVSSGAPMTIPLADMEYDVPRACFIHRGPGFARRGFGIIGDPGFEFGMIKYERDKEGPHYEN